MRPERLRTTNKSEIRVANELMAMGYEVVKNGWPDFVAIKEGEVRFIEVKPDGHKAGLKPRQQKMARILRRLGIKVELAVGSMTCLKPANI